MRATAYPLTCPIITRLRARRRRPAVFLEFIIHGNCTPRPRYVWYTRGPAGRVACPRGDHHSATVRRSARTTPTNDDHRRTRTQQVRIERTAREEPGFWFLFSSTKKPHHLRRRSAPQSFPSPPSVIRVSQTPRATKGEPWDLPVVFGPLPRRLRVRKVFKKRLPRFYSNRNPRRESAVQWNDRFRKIRMFSETND